MATFKDRFKEQRIKKGYTLKELGEKLGYSESNLSLYESGKRQPKTAEDYVRIAEFFGVTCDYLLGRTDDEKMVVMDNSNLPIPEEFNDLNIKIEDYPENVPKNITKEMMREMIREILLEHGVKLAADNDHKINK